MSISSTKLKVDLIVSPIKEMVSPIADGGPARGRNMSSVECIKNGAIAIRDGTIVACGAKDSVMESVEISGVTNIIDASDKLVTPGLVDPHTHLIFAGNRHNEFAMRCQGKTYAEIAAAGGGIVASMKATRQADVQELIDLGRVRLKNMALHGTTSCEVKTGYGLDKRSELNMLEAILKLDSLQEVELTPTFMPAHAVPPGHKRDEYVREIIEEILPAALQVMKANGRQPGDLYVDVFCDEGYFSLADTQAIFERAVSLGMKLKVHADEFKSLGATSLACDMGAQSADHLLAVTQSDIERLAHSSCVAVLLPGTSFFLNLNEHAPARKMVEEGVAIAVGSDFNPGSCHIFSLPFIMGLSCLKLGLTAEEALTAMTMNAAYAIGRGANIGQLRSGYQADIVLWNVSTLAEIPYNMAWNPISTVIKKGAVIK